MRKAPRISWGDVVRRLLEGEPPLSIASVGDLRERDDLAVVGGTEIELEDSSKESVRKGIYALRDERFLRSRRGALYLVKDPDDVGGKPSLGVCLLVPQKWARCFAGSHLVLTGQEE